MTRRLPTIAHRLMLLVLACLAPALLASALLINAEFREGSKVLNADALTLTRTTVAAIDREVLRMQTILLVLATSPHLERDDLASFKEQALKVRAGTGALNFVLTQPSGQTILNLQAPPGAALPMHGNPELIKKTIATGRPQISDLFRTGFSAQPLIVVAVPVFRGTDVAYVLTGGFLPTELGRILLDQRYPNGWIGALVDTRRVIVARTHQAERFVGIKTPVAALLDAQNEGSVEARTLEGVEVTTSFSHSATTHWAVILGAPRSQLYAPVWRYIAVSVGLVALLLLAGLSAAVWIGRRIAGSISDLAAPVKALAAGVPVEAPRLYFNEAQQLADVLEASGRILLESRTETMAAERRLSGILDSGMDAVIAVDEQHCVVLFNTAAVAMFGWAADEAMGQPLAKFIPARFAAVHHEHVERFAAAGMSRRRMGVQGDLLALRRNGEEFPIEASISKIQEGERQFFTAILRDVSEQLAGRLALERSNQDLRHFAFVASHDLKGPLRTISGFVNLLERGYSSQLGPKGMELLQRTGKAAGRLEQMTEALLMIAQVDGSAPQLKPVDLNVLVNDVLLLLHVPIEEAEATIDVEPLPVVLGFGDQLEHVFLNLLGNSLKFKADRPLVIQIRAHRDGPGWVVSLSDNGIGIDPVHQEKVFQVFSRIHSRQQYEGVGIGLALCRRIIERHGGKIWIESTAGAGSTFRMSLTAA